MCKLAIVGCGKIARFHVPAMKAAGFTISAIGGREGTETYLNDFAKEFNLPDAVIYSDPNMLLTSSSWDALLLCCPTEYMLSYIRAAVNKNKPILVEKPVSNNFLELKKFFKYENIKVAYNRRYYKTVDYAKKFLADNEITLIKVSIPEVSDEKFNSKFFPERLPIKSYENSVHVFDLLRYLVGDIYWTHSESIASNNSYKALVGFGKSKRGNAIILDSCFNSSDNFAIQMVCGSKRLALKPLESAKLFDGMDVQQPSIEIPIRSYSPVLQHQIIETDINNMKLGFALQAKDFRGFCNGKKSAAATIYDSYKALELIENLKR